MRQCLYTACKGRKALSKPKTSSKAIWIKKSNLASCEAKKSLVLASHEATEVSNCETDSALHRAQLHHSREAKGKAPIGANSEATAALLKTKESLSSARRTLSRKARIESPLSANNEATITLLKTKSALKASPGEAKPCGEAKHCREAIIASPATRSKASKAKFNAFQPQWTCIQSF